MEDLVQWFLDYFPDVEKIILNYPATILVFKDGTKSVVKHDESGGNDVEIAILYAYAKKHARNYRKNKKCTLRNSIIENFVMGRIAEWGVPY